MQLIKPQKLSIGDTIATVSISHGWAGDEGIRWKYELGKKCLEEIFGLNVIAAPNSMRGSRYLQENPQARAEDIMWAFENKNVRAIIANIGGNDSIRLIPFIDIDVIKANPKILIGFSDVMNIHLLCYKAGLSTFYGHNLFSLAEAQGLHSYNEKWFRKVLFDTSPIGIIEPAKDWTFECPDHFNPNYVRKYCANDGYHFIQGSGCVSGRLMGGHTQIMELANTSIELSAEGFKDAILFIEDIPEFFSPTDVEKFFDWLGDSGILQNLNGVVIGKLNQSENFNDHAKALVHVVCDKFGKNDLPILYGLNFGHSAPICIIPYSAYAQINCTDVTFSILESGVI